MGWMEEMERLGLQEQLGQRGQRARLRLSPVRLERLEDLDPPDRRAIMECPVIHRPFQVHRDRLDLVETLDRLGRRIAF